MLFDLQRRKRFKQCIEPYRADVHRFLLWLCYDPTLTEDVLQETFLRAWRSLDKLQDDAAAKSWLLTIARRELARNFSGPQTQLINIDDLPELEHSSSENAEELDDMRRAVRQLDVSYREPLILQIWFGYSTKEIAEHMELSQQAVLTRLFRGREKLRDLWEGNTGDDSPAGNRTDDKHDQSILSNQKT